MRHYTSVFISHETIITPIEEKGVVVGVKLDHPMSSYMTLSFGDGPTKKRFKEAIAKL